MCVRSLGVAGDLETWNCTDMTNEQPRDAESRQARFRPCIDLHNGRVKQIVGSTLKDNDRSSLVTNFVSDRSAFDYARMYAEDGLQGGHVIKLGPGCDEEALKALKGFPGGMQVGGGINCDNAAQFLEAGASHVIVTSYVFNDGSISWDRLKALVAACGGKDRVVLDLSCRKKGDGLYYVVTNRWQTFTDFSLTADNLIRMSEFCDEFLVHGVDMEGLRLGIIDELVELLGRISPLPVTYAGGVRNIQDLERVHVLGQGKVDVTVGSALDILGGDLEYKKVVEWSKRD